VDGAMKTASKCQVARALNVPSYNRNPFFYWTTSGYTTKEERPHCPCQKDEQESTHHYSKPH
jgi:hypothetical protein